MMKVIVKHNPEYATAVEVYDVEDINDARDLIDEAAQGFGQGIILTNDEFDDICANWLFQK
jgi:hypothetical protein